MKLGLFGGSFDPVHNGHVLPVLAAREKFGLDRVIYLPTARPPHKPGRQFAPSHRRFSMVELALIAQPDLLVSAQEWTPKRPAFTVETLEHFHGNYPDAELFLLIGGDSFASFDRWKRWKDILTLANLVVLVRPGWELELTREQLSPQVAALVEDERVHFLANETVSVSSTELRRRIAAGEPLPDGAVPELVLEYIRKYTLYS